MLQNEKKKYQLAAVSMVAQFSIAMANFSLIYFLRAKGFDSFEIGVAASLNPLFYFLSCLAFNLILKERRPKGEVIISFVAMAISIALVLLSRNKALVFISLSLYGISNSLLWPNVETWITQNQENKELGASVAAFNFSWSFGAGVSTFVGGFLSSKSTTLPLAVVVISFILLALFTLTVKRPERKEESKVESAEDRSTYLRYFCWIGIVLLYIGYTLIITIFPLYALEKLGISEERTGTLLLFRGLSACASFIVIGRFSFWQFKAWFVLLMQACFVLLVASLGVIKSSIGFSIDFLLFGFVFASIYELSIFHGAAGAKNREKRMMLHEVLLTSGSIVGSLFGGYIYKYFSFQMIIAFLSIASFFILIVEIPFIIKGKKSRI